MTLGRFKFFCNSFGVSAQYWDHPKLPHTVITFRWWRFRWKLMVPFWMGRARRR